MLLELSIAMVGSVCIVTYKKWKKNHLFALDKAKVDLAYAVLMDKEADYLDRTDAFNMLGDYYSKPRKYKISDIRSMNHVMTAMCKEMNELLDTDSDKYRKSKIDDKAYLIPEQEIPEAAPTGPLPIAKPKLDRSHMTGVGREIPAPPIGYVNPFHHGPDKYLGNFEKFHIGDRRSPKQLELPYAYEKSYKVLTGQLIDPSDPYSPYSPIIDKSLITSGVLIPEEWKDSDGKYDSNIAAASRLTEQIKVERPSLPNAKDEYGNKC